MIRNYLDHEMIPVTVVGGGRDRDYGYLGFSHWADDDLRLMGGFKNLNLLRPNTEEELEMMFTQLIAAKLPTYLNLRK
jgi:transketolase C-terminal domain/subunit